ncbi:polysaccharide biosynthesis protein [Edaphobacillus lindanitolerans]|uniref:NDP-sugar epimerase, includes UDP-GlcNAc-inverting 4,6-dehydratase FlaA1 and capsular polysaccharide biosynthesis protein EpsC n=1 Tax=Edaphobacillus lindanitolerans TaxID=550447 RepID=A0A1U7PN64_9BACI|nr:nucleoside-diphosphate sugar epimerase/dehydratase [Edaphobacillus lindanitolerans]SIT73669.1 NDP-sugar epimerase, includes UDP-GlcNAc-inverting 4,6-dehydratase FlaA1 and capsular polysaccharide biosynthesis protein EpsC [Edaphobacillus lindanitolerans]
MSYPKRLAGLATIDSFIVFLSIYVSFLLLNPTPGIIQSKTLLISALTIFVAHHVTASFYGLYKKAWAYASVGELKAIIKSVTITIAVVSVVQLIGVQHIYFRALMITWMLHLMLIGGSRFVWRMYRDSKVKRTNGEFKPTMVVGAGQAGTMVVRQMNQNPENGLKPIVFVDDDRTKQQLDIYGVNVAGGLKDIPRLVKEHQIENIVIAIPSMPKMDTAELTKLCIDTGARTQTIPRIEDLMTGKVSVNDIRDVKIEDLLGREEVELDMKAIADKLENKTILVTGAGGSIGSEICRQVMRFQPKKLVLVGHGENSIYLIDRELKGMGQNTEIIPVIADVQDRNRIFDIISELAPDVIYHAAAHKHVPLMEANPFEAVKNNIFGTKNVAEAADTFGVGYFVLVSTDKAVNPPNVMGATKRFAEMVVQNLAKTSNTKFAAVRFGNVLGSRGSVVPLFKKQIAAGGPVTVTDERMTRYFMTIPEASRLVIQAGTLASGGEVFVLDMGEPVKITDLARNLIKLSGYEVEDIGIAYSGIRPGEKLYEELLDTSEIQQEQVFPKIHIGRATPIAESEQLYVLSTLSTMKEEELKLTLISLANRKIPESPSKSLTKV